MRNISYFQSGTTAERNALAAPSVNSLFLNTDNNEFEFWNGASWIALASTFSVINGLSVSLVSNPAIPYNINADTDTVILNNVPAGPAATINLPAGKDGMSFIVASVNNNPGNLKTQGTDVFEGGGISYDLAAGGDAQFTFKAGVWYGVAFV